MYKAVDVYLEKRKTRQYVGRLQREKRKFIFQYDKFYLSGDKPIPIGPDLPLQLKQLGSKNLFPSFADRIPSKQNPAYKEYCWSVGINPLEKDSLVLLAKLGQKDPSSFVCVPVEESQKFSAEDLKLFRKSLKLSIREFSALFAVSSATVYRIENNKTSGKDTLKKIEIYYRSPQACLEQIKITGDKINESKRLFVESFLKSKIRQNQPMPIGPFTVSAEDIKQCNSQQIVELIERLSLMECYQYNIPQSAVHFSSNISAKDAGQDGLVSWSQSPSYTDYFPSRYNCLQIKAKLLSPKECEKEVLDKQKLKSALQEVITKRGAYIIVSTQLVSGVYLKAREEAIYQGIKTAAYDPELIQIKFYDANIIASWLNKFPPLAVWFLKEVCGKEKSPWLTWKEWSREDPDYRSDFMFHEELKAKRDKIYNILSEPRKTAHLAGASGMGKTRLALEVFRSDSNKPIRSENPCSPQPLPERETQTQKLKYEQNNTAVDLSHLVLYSSAENLNTTHLRELKNSRAILVIDDCSLEKAEEFHKIAIQEDSQLSLLTIGNEETEQGLESIIRRITNNPKNHIIKLEPDKEITKKILSRKQNISNTYLDPKYDKLTSGFPFMAVLLKSAGPMNLLKDDIPTIKKKMLWGRAEPDRDGEKVIKACSLFDTIGIKTREGRFSFPRARRKEEAEYIAEKICKLDYDTFYEKIQFFKKKKIIQQLGNFIQVRPKPLAVWLASEFIEQSPEETVTKWLTEMRIKASESPMGNQKLYPSLHIEFSQKEREEFEKQQEDPLVLHGLRESFCKQLSYLSSYETAKNLVQQLCNEQGIFGKKETLYTQWGFHCLYYLVELDSEVVLQTLERVFRDKNPSDLKELSIWHISLHFGKTICPELVWILEKLAREKDLYLRSARLLLKLAEIDIASSPHSQAMQVFVNHFQLYLSGTTASPKEKFQIIEEIKNLQTTQQEVLNRDSIKQKEIQVAKNKKSAKVKNLQLERQERESLQFIRQKELAISALDKALHTGGWSCSSDLMKTKSGQDFEHWKPKTYGEQWDYFRTAFEHLIDFSIKESNQEIQEKAGSAMASHFNSLLKQGLYKEVKKAILSVVSVHGSQWPLARDRLLSFLKYNPDIKEDNKKQVKEMLELLKPKDLNERICSYVTECPSEILYNKIEGRKSEEYDKHFNQLISDFVNVIEPEVLKQTKKLNRAHLKTKSISSEKKLKKNPILNNLSKQTNKQCQKAEEDNNSNSLSKETNKADQKAEKIFEILFHGEQRNTLLFAEKLVEKLKDPWRLASYFLSLAVKWKSNESFNPVFLSGFTVGLKKRDSKKTKQFLDQIANDNDLADFLTLSYEYIFLENQDIERLISIIHKINLQPNDLMSLGMGQKCKSVSLKLMEKLIDILVKKGVGYSWSALRIYDRYVYPEQNPKNRKQLQKVLYKLLTRNDLLSKKEKRYNATDDYIYKRAFKDILRSEDKELFSKKFLAQVFAPETSIFDFSISTYEIKECCKKIVKICPHIFLEQVTKYIDSPNIDFIFKDRHSFPSRLDSENSLLSNLPEDLIKKWCTEAPDKIPAFLARNINLFDNGRLSSLSKFLLDEYGDQIKLTEAVSFNLGSFSWAGNISAYFTSVQTALKELIDHKYKNVHDFASREISHLEDQIRDFKQKEQERTEFDIW